MDYYRRPFKPQRMQDHKRTHFNPMGTPATSLLSTPIIRIEDHQSEVLSCDFHPSGKFLLSSNRDGQILLCDIYGTFSKTTLLQGHLGPVMEAQFSTDGFNVYSCSTDGTLGVWDTFRGFRVTRLDGHIAGVNCVQGARIGYPVLCSGSNDGAIRVWDVREKECAIIMKTGNIVTTTCFSNNAEYVISGGYDKDINVWDLRKREIAYKLEGHTGKVTGIALSPCGSYLLSNCVDNTLRVWDVRPNVTFKRCVGLFPSNLQPDDGLLRCAWSPDGTKISAATSDRDVFVWDAMTGKTLHELSGHESAITDIAFHPKESVILSSSNDRYLYLHEM